MAATKIPFNAPSYMFHTADMSGSKVNGISYIDALTYDVDARKCYIVSDDLTLQPYVLVTSGSAWT